MTRANRHGRAWSWDDLPWVVQKWKEISGDKPFVLKGIQSGAFLMLVALARHQWETYEARKRADSVSSGGVQSLTRSELPPPTASTVRLLFSLLGQLLFASGF